jgi:hypothetical protein
MAVEQPNADKVSWSVKNWCRDTDLSPAYAYELINDKKISSVKVGGKRLITTSPRDFVARLADPQA